jgi:methylmalonyl-CoA/ethylmalonyl-CoA epimerase
MQDLSFRLHHIGLLVRSIETATALQVARYGYQIESDIILDPVQTAHVRFLRLNQGTHWLELVSPASEQSKLSNALAKKGEGLHHLCYEVDDIATACEHLRQERQMLLSAPVPAVAFGGRPIAWFLDRAGLLTELVEAGQGPLSLDDIIPRHSREHSS